MKRHVVSRVTYGLIFILLGAAVLVQVSGIYDFGSLSHSWWTLFLIVPGLVGLLTSGFEFWNVALIAIGVWLLATDQNWLPEHSGLWLLGALLILLGLQMLFGSHTHHWGHGYEGRVERDFEKKLFTEDNDTFPIRSCVFSSMRIVSRCQALRGGKADAVFGTLVLNLREVGIESNAEIEINAVFGKIVLLAPKNVPLKFELTPVFGSCRNSAAFPAAQDGAAALTIKGAAVFGSIEVI